MAVIDINFWKQKSVCLLLPRNTQCFINSHARVTENTGCHARVTEHMDCHARVTENTGCHAHVTNHMDCHARMAKHMCMQSVWNFCTSLTDKGTLL